jgi:dienelactone hydrolase
MMVDAYRALDLLVAHPRVDASRIAVMGFSKGAVASIFSASTRFRQLYGSQARFAAHIGLYTPCNTRFIGDTEVTGAPMRLFHGTTDDYVSVVPCREFVSQLRARGVDVALTEYADSEHGYDNPLSPRKVPVPTSQTTRNCQLLEAAPGRVVNASTRQPFGYGDSCVAIGAHIGHNPEATLKTWRAVVAFMQGL